ncbi:hypothetical protein [Xanthocytophaga flava]|uniref:hypothetical protein n=1 Tax=Xanthocytophaga flava TaxID=3048013 RepID=UPI0028D51E34|nr:hypothetical protein [Xanthocytophaga flavus]MDJ1469526.1 hypothetical protein [Xanthocytophaga flavus]
MVIEKKTVKRDSSPKPTSEKEISLPEASKDFWLRLDNAAKIYPAIQSRELTTVFRLSAVLKDRVKIKPFLEAVQRLEERFPYYKMKPKKGFFWYYLQYYNEKMAVRPDLGLLCRSFEKNELIFRILLKENKVSVEFSHILTDGKGAFEFLNSLLLTYFEVCCLIDTDALSYLKPEETPSAEEFEDAFSTHFQERLPFPLKIPTAFHLPFRLKPLPRFEVLSFSIPAKEIIAIVRKYNVTLTVYLVGVYLSALQTIYNQLSPAKKRRSRKVFRIQVPINLRKLYHSKTMRNFSLFVTPEIDLRLGKYTFEEILKTVHHLMQLETDVKLINKIISRNVGAERNVLLKNTPLFIKSLILYFTYSIEGTRKYSGVITNLGKVSFSPQADRLIEYFQFIPPPPNKVLKVNCGVIGFEDKLILSFGNITTSHQLEQEFVSILIGEGIPVKVIS